MDVPQRSSSDTPAAGPDGDGGRPADPVEQLLVECLIASDDADAIGARVEAACRRFPEHAEDLRARLRILQEAGFFGAAGPDASALPERLGGYQLLRRIGSGGMGVVYLAREEALDRPVALKLVRPEHLYFPDSIERFRREVRIVAGLRHPGIVPVYAVGEARGIPFFAMEHVAGANLQEALARLHGRPPERLTGLDLAEVIAQGAADGSVPPPGERSFGHAWPEVCLRLALQVAQALAHVHDHGVLHRDVKPSNLMVTPAGHAMLLDFGLSASSDASRLTRSGAMGGSLPYMSPEQVRGGISGLDARTDIYSLGVTLYEMLTLTCPFLGEDAEDTRRKILAGDPKPLRELNRAVTWDAETVCLKAMERDPSRRYATAAELAQDLTNLLEYRPIVARRSGPMLRLRRLAQRRPALAVAAALGSLLLLLMPVAALGIDVQRRRAEANLDEALRAINQMLTRLGNEQLQNVPQADVVRRQLLADALQFCRRLEAEYPGHRRIRLEMGATLQKAGWIQASLGDRDEARQSLTEAIGIFSALPVATISAEELFELASAERRLGTLLRETREYADAEAWARRAIGHWQQLLDRHPQPGPRRVQCLGEEWRNLAHVLTEKGARTDGEQALQTALQLLERSHAEFPGDQHTALSLSNALGVMGVWRISQQRSPEALPFLQRAHDLAQQLVERAPDDSLNLRQQANAAQMLAMALAQTGSAEAAVVVGRNGIAVRERLSMLYSGRIDLDADLGMALNNLAGVFMTKLGDFASARDVLTHAIAVQRRVLAVDPSRAEAHSTLRVQRANLAECLLRVGPLDELHALADDADEARATGGEDLLQCARLLCVCVEGCQVDESIAEAVGAQRADALGARAVACLRRAVAAGLLEVERFRGGRYQVLARRPDYRQLVAEARAGTKPGR